MVFDDLVLCIYHPAMHRGATMYVTFYFLLLPFYFLYPLSLTLSLADRLCPCLLNTQNFFSKYITIASFISMVCSPGFK